MTTLRRQPKPSVTEGHESLRLCGMREKIQTHAGTCLHSQTLGNLHLHASKSKNVHTQPVSPRLVMHGVCYVWETVAVETRPRPQAHTVTQGHGLGTNLVQNLGDELLQHLLPITLINAAENTAAFPKKHNTTITNGHSCSTNCVPTAYQGIPKQRAGFLGRRLLDTHSGSQNARWLDRRPHCLQDTLHGAAVPLPLLLEPRKGQERNQTSTRSRPRTP